MSMVDVRNAFTAALAGKAQVVAARMDCIDGGRQQRLSFDIETSDGTQETVTEVVAASVDLVTKATQMGASKATEL